MLPFFLFFLALTTISATGDGGLDCDPVPDKYIDKNLSEALEAGMVDHLGEEWLRECCFGTTLSVLEAAGANRTAILGKASRPRLWGSFGVSRSSWATRPIATIRTTAQVR